jgi:hypothetical protein
LVETSQPGHPRSQAGAAAVVIRAQRYPSIDISHSRPMQLSYDMPLPQVEPQYALMIGAGKWKAFVRFTR